MEPQAKTNNCCRRLKLKFQSYIRSEETGGQFNYITLYIREKVSADLLI
jgi:hypothetical protein